MKWEKTEAPITVRRPQTTMERLLIAPSTEPISIAFAVPTAWELDPIAIPLAMGYSILNSIRTPSAITLPITPVITMTTTARGT